MIETSRLPLPCGLIRQIAPALRNRRMPNGMYGGVRGRKTKVGRKPLRFPPTRLTINLKWICRKRNGKNEFYDGGYIEK